MGQAQAFLKNIVQLVSYALEPMAPAKAFVRQVVLMQLFAGEVLEIRIKQPMLSHFLIRDPISILKRNTPIMTRSGSTGWPESPANPTQLLQYSRSFIVPLVRFLDRLEAIPSFQMPLRGGFFVP